MSGFPDIDRAVALAERRMHPDAWEEARQVWRRWADHARADPLGVHIHQNLIYCLRKMRTEEAVHKVLRQASATHLKPLLADQFWAWKCQRVCDQLLSRSLDAGKKVIPPIGQRLEFFGAPGVGKSSIIRAVGAVRDPSQPRLLIVGRLGKKLRPEHVQRSERAFQRLATATGRNAASPFWDRYEGPIRRRYALVQVYEDQYRRRFALHNEGPAQAGLNLPNSGLALHREFFRYYWLIPAPAAALLVCAQPDDIRQRNHERGLLIRHKDRGGKRFSMLWMIDIACKIMQARGVRLINIDNEGSVDHACAQVLEAVNTLRNFPAVKPAMQDVPARSAKEAAEV
jgi:hypothetical protein